MVYDITDYQLLHCSFVTVYVVCTLCQSIDLSLYLDGLFYGGCCLVDQLLSFAFTLCVVEV